MRAYQRFGISRRFFLAAAAGIGATLLATPMRAAGRPPIDATFLFSNDIHACLVSTEGLAPNCAAEGKTDANLLRHVAALNALPTMHWPETVGGQSSGLGSAGRRIGTPLGLVVGGDMTDDGGGRCASRARDTQLQQFTQRYSGRTGCRPRALARLCRARQP